MLAPRNGRVSLYTLPLVVVIGFLSVAGLAAWQRSDVIADLADQVAHGEKAESTAAVRQLAAIPNPPLSILVEAAASDEHATAEAAQSEINRMLGKWQKQVDKKQRVSSVAAQVTELATALAARRQGFPASDYPWLTGATRKILRVASGCPAKKTPLVALHCDEIMSVIGRSNPKRSLVVEGDEPLQVAPTKEIAVPAAEADSRESRHVQLEREFSEFPNEPMTRRIEPNAVAPAPVESSPIQTPARVNANLEAKESSSDPEWIGKVTPSETSGQGPVWAQPSLRVLPTTATGSAGSTGEGKPQASTEVDKAESSVIETRALMEGWSEAQGGQRLELEEDLASRGFRRLSPRLVKQYLSEDLATRMRIVDSVLTEPGVNAKPWLLLLAEDENADVRLLAVTVMATSDDKSLVEAAWQVAVHDRDPRVADMAARLRGRR